MTQEEIFAKVITAFEKAGVKYMITGSIASIRYGRPRVTHGMDTVVSVSPLIGTNLAAELGNEFYFDAEGFKEAGQKVGFFEIIHPNTGLKVDCWFLKGTEYDITSFNRRKKVGFAGIQAYFATPRRCNSIKVSVVQTGSISKTPR